MGAKGEAMWTMGTLVRGLNLLAKVEEGKEGEGRGQQEGKTCLRHNSHLKCSRSSSEETSLVDRCVLSEVIGIELGQ